MLISKIYVLLFQFVACAVADSSFHSPSPDKQAFSAVRDEVAALLAQNIIRGSKSPISLRRNLGAFDELNDLFDGLVLALPDIYVEADKKILGATVRLWATNLKCGSLRVEDISIDYGLSSNTRFDFGVDIRGLDISCTLNWRYRWSFVKGSGSAQIYTDNNDAQTSIRFTSQGYDQHPPSGSSVNSCNSSIKITDMDFQGGIFATILDIFEKSLRGVVSDEIEKTSCDELGSLGTTLVEDMLNYVYELIESYLSEIPPEYKDVLNSEKELVLPEEINLINFTDFGSTLGVDTMGTLFQTSLHLLDQTLGTMIKDPNSDDSENMYDLGINILLRSAVLNDEGALIIDVTELPDYAATSGVIFQGHDMLTETVITLNEMKLFGLDTFESFDPLNAAGQYTLGNNFFWDHLRAEFSLTLVMKPSTKSNSIIEGSTDAEVREMIVVSVGINDIDVDFNFLFGVVEDELGKLQLGSILDTSMIMPCLLPALFATEVSGFTASVGDMEPPVLSGFISTGIDRIVSKAADAVYIMYESTLIKALPNFFELTVRNITNEAIADIFGHIQENSTCIRFEEESLTQNQEIHFGDLLLPAEDSIMIGGSGEEQYGTLVRDMVSLFRTEIQAVNPVSNTLYMNEIFMRNFTKSLSGTPGVMSFPSDLFNSDSDFKIGELSASVQLRLSDAHIENMDSFSLPLKVLEPLSGSCLSNVITLGAENAKPLRTSSLLTIAFSDGNDINIRNVINFGMEIRNATVQVDALISMIESRFLQFPIEDVNNLDCWLSTIPAPALDSRGVRLESIDPTLALEKVKIVMESIRFQIDCVECTSPKFQEISDILTSDEAVEDVTKLANGAVEYLSGLLGGEFLQVKMDRLLADAAKRCPHNSEFVNVTAGNTQYLPFEDPKTLESDFNLFLAIAPIFGALFAVIVTSIVILNILRTRRYTKWIDTLSEDEVIKNKFEQVKEREKQKLIDTGTLPMFQSPLIPRYIRFWVPLIILANIGFFLSGHLSLGASVDINAHIGGEKVRIEGLFIFSMAESLVDMWEAGAVELAILVALLSGLWPYTKQLIVMFLWFAPTRIVSVKRRESLLLWLDALGKWSFVDIFVLIMSVPSFRVSISSPNDISFIPPDTYGLNLLVIPRWGLYSNMIAQILSQINSHLIIHCHRKVLRDFKRGEQDSAEVVKQTDEPRRLYDHMFKSKGMGEGPASALRKGINGCLFGFSVIFVGLLSTGIFTASFSLSQFGLVGLAVEASPGQSSYIAHNVFSTISLLMNQAKFTGIVSDYIGLLSLSAIFFVTVIAVPMVQLGFLFHRWFGNLDNKSRRRNFVVVEALQSWQYVEVYIFSILITSWQLGSVSEFLINDYCGSFDELFNALAYYGILRPVDSQCFKVEANVQPGTWILMSASLFLLVLRRLISSASRQQEDDIEDINTDIAIEAEITFESLDDVRLKPSPATFSDNYAWLLTSVDDDIVDDDEEKITEKKEEYIIEDDEKIIINTSIQDY